MIDYFLRFTGNEQWVKSVPSEFEWATVSHCTISHLISSALGAIKLSYNSYRVRGLSGMVHF